MKITPAYAIITALITLMIIPGCIRRVPSVKRIIKRKNIHPKAIDPSQPTPPPTLTVWIHGTTLGIRYFHDGPSGLNPLEKTPPYTHLYKLLSHLSLMDPVRFPHDHLYSFGWTGKLSPKEREQAAKRLYHELKQEINTYYHKTGITPRLRLITHSHGGNVALNLVPHAQGDSSFSIDELILLACPVQHATAHHLKSPLIKKIYALYADADIAQMGDAQGFHAREEKKKKGLPFRPLFSGQCFSAQPNMIQARVKIDGRILTHVEFALKVFVRLIPTVIDELDLVRHHVIAEPDTDVLISIRR